MLLDCGQCLSSQVVGVDLGALDLVGTLPADLQHASQLTRIVLSGNGFAGENMGTGCTTHFSLRPNHNKGPGVSPCWPALMRGERAAWIGFVLHRASFVT